MKYFFILICALLCLPRQNQAQAFYRLPPTVNDPTSDQIAPVISEDGHTLFFARSRLALDSSMVFDIWMSLILSDPNSAPAQILGGPLASRYGIAVTSVAPDNNTLYLMGKFEESTPPEERIFVTHRTKTGWSIPERVHIPNLHLREGITDYSFGPDQKTLLMAVEADSSMGNRDLYVSFLNSETEKWSSPLWLGPTVNSPYTEMTPYLSADNVTLYFSSSRPGGLGEVDVYRSTRLDDTWKHWTTPENVGNTINRPGRTSYYTEDVKHGYAYFCWKPSSQANSAIFRSPISRPIAVALVHGFVRDENGNPHFATIRYARQTDGREMGTARANPLTGEYQLSIPAGSDYILEPEAEGYAGTGERLDLAQLHQSRDVEKDLKITKIKSGAVIRLNNIFFDVDRSELLPNSYAELDRLKKIMVEHPSMKIEIQGHTDSTGSESHNALLSKARADAVNAYLVSQGIEPARIISNGFGSSHPLSTNATEEGRAQNRRVEFHVLNGE